MHRIADTDVADIAGGPVGPQANGVAAMVEMQIEAGRLSLEHAAFDARRLAAEAVAAAGRSLDAGLDLARQTTSAISAPLPLALPDEPQEPAKPPAPAPR